MHLVISRRGLLRHTRVVLIGFGALLAFASPAVAREPVDPATLNPAPPPAFNAVCFARGSGIACDLAFDDPAIVDEPSGIVCDGVELRFSQTRSVVGKRFYDANGDLLQRHFRESLAGTFTNPDTGLVATWIQHDTVIHNLAVPGDIASGTIKTTGLESRVWVGGRTVIIDAGRFLENAATGELISSSGPHPFFNYFALGDAAALQPLCDALD